MASKKKRAKKVSPSEKRRRRLAALKGWKTRKRNEKKRKFFNVKRTPPKPTKPASPKKSPSKSKAAAKRAAPEPKESPLTEWERPSLGPRKKTLFERGPLWAGERKRLRAILGHAPTEAQIERAVKAREQELQRAREDELMKRALDNIKRRGIKDNARFQKISKRFGVELRDVYNFFFGYPMSVGQAA